MTNLPAPTEADIQQVVDLVVETVSPLRIVLFGSAARGELRSGSDLDMMVVVPEGADRHAVSKRLYLAMARERIGLPVEFHVATTDAVERYRDDAGYYYFEALRQGHELYAA